LTEGISNFQRFVIPGPINCIWSDWADWQSCGASCGETTKKRTSNLTEELLQSCMQTAWTGANDLLILVPRFFPIKLIGQINAEEAKLSEPMSLGPTAVAML